MGGLRGPLQSGRTGALQRLLFALDGPHVIPVCTDSISPELNIPEPTMKLLFPLALSVAAIACAGCGGDNTESAVEAPGADTTAKTDVLEAGAAILQNKEPLEALNAYMNGFHFYNGNMKGQMEAHHYCALLNEDVTQCVIFDGNTKDSKIMGVEYIVSGKVFAGLPAEEKHMWHSHVHEVRSGQLIAPSIPEVAEKQFMEKIAGTYGKTWHTWHTDQERELPVGSPMLMMGFTQDGQADAAMVAARDERFGVSSTKNRENRAEIEYPAIDPDADAWQKGIVVQLEAVVGKGDQDAVAHASH
jgi:hypothetical protein